MSAPRVEIDLSKIRQNTETLVGRLKTRGIGVTGVTKAVCGLPAVAQAMLDGGAVGLADARLGNVIRLRNAGVSRHITLIRTPLLSQTDQVVRVCDASYNTEMVVITALAAAAIRQGTVHGINLMIELGDLREGILPEDLSAIAEQVLDMPGVSLTGIGANFGCLGKIAPDAAKMAILTSLAEEIENLCCTCLQTVSGGNSANLTLAFRGQQPSRINDLRLGESILLGVDPLSRAHIVGMHRDAFALVAEIIETDTKPDSAQICAADTALSGRGLNPTEKVGNRLILALGHQDTDIFGLSMPPGYSLVGATSDHLVIGTNREVPRVGSEVRFQMAYSALMRAMAAPDIEKKAHHNRGATHAQTTQSEDEGLALA
ncbi:alanine/ornithine racemase family PLP-dependent enzyme [Palleronia caenipelagi]|uniref:Alanine/ornithine racemase family PLP-dependent enzyme n=1 Tax=Palleronia caenipelagi TaxID=2489174 RepID=A0A547PXQ7_9RHOB|nr:alanine/ornithine racemase family PLP-dependent enzyme [Palleronia caenipelagi]TRD18925.1 alanine/ornithine racemase family PLP-dependent enzyme [Palleronia caenipelagi]